MTTPLSDHQFELGGVAFGIDTPVTIEDEGFDPGTWDQRIQDVPDVYGDTTTFGRDYLTPPTWIWQLSTDRDDEEGALESLAELQAVWSHSPVRSSPRAVVPLRYRLAGRYRVVYGRPRRFGLTTSNRSMQGYLAITADFSLADPRVYEDEERQQVITLTPATSTGGLTTPLMAPLAAVSDTTPRVQQIVVGGGVATPIRVTFSNAAVNPWVRVGGWTCRLSMATAFDDQITVDPRPWARNVTRADGTSPGGGVLSRYTYIADMVLAPGTYQVEFGSDDPGSSGVATLRWRDAHPSI